MKKIRHVKLNSEYPLVILLFISILSCSSHKYTNNAYSNCIQTKHNGLVNSTWSVIKIRTGHKDSTLARSSLEIMFDSLGAFAIIENKKLIYKGISIHCQKGTYKYFFAPIAEKIDGLLPMGNLWNKDDWEFNLSNSLIASKEVNEITYILNTCTLFTLVNDSTYLIESGEEQFYQSVTITKKM